MRTPKSIAGWLLLVLSIGFIADDVAVAQSDNELLEIVEYELQSDPVISEELLYITVEDGIVMMSGRHFTLLCKRRTNELIMRLRGVRAIVDHSSVISTGKNDAELHTLVTEALRDDPVSESRELQVSVSKGAVSVEGTVDSYAEKQLVENAIAGVDGVLSIGNGLRVELGDERPEDEVRSEIKRRFEIDPFLSHELVEIEVDQRDVILTGNVGSLNEKAMAGILAWVAGVKSVDTDRLEVRPLLDHEWRRDSLVTLFGDSEIRQAVQDALLYDPLCRGDDISVRVRQAAVTLSGQVATHAAKKSAEATASRTVGVRRVINNLKVKYEAWPGDAAIARDVRKALKRDSQLRSLEIRAASHFGQVYLRGLVNSHFDKERAELVAANIQGVLDVDNRIAVDSQWKPKPDREIGEDLLRRLRWSPLFRTDQIEVSVEDGIARLSGTVEGWHQRKEIEQLALRSGAKDVRNEVRVASFPDQ